MRRFSILLALPVLLSSSFARAHDSTDPVDDDSYSYERHHQKAEIGIALEALRSSPTVINGSGVMGGYIGMHGRFGSRIALGFGIEQGYGDDPSGFKRYDIAWNLPKLYMYLNPGSRSQLYVTTGLDMRVSHFEGSAAKPLPGGTPWGLMYFGSFFGGGIEHRLDKTMALRMELRGFLRGRASGSGSGQPALDPEFNDKTQSSRGAVVSLGLVFF